MMNHPAKSRKADLDLGRRSKQLAEDERGLVVPDRLAQTITEFIEWRAFSYCLRLIVETQGFVSDPLIANLQERCPGFLEYAAAYTKEQPQQPAADLESLANEAKPLTPTQWSAALPERRRNGKLGYLDPPSLERIADARPDPFEAAYRQNSSRYWRPGFHRSRFRTWMRSSPRTNPKTSLRAWASAKKPHRHE